jgi:hypothetical protein
MRIATLLIYPFAAHLVGVGSFDGDASPPAVLEIGGQEVRIPSPLRSSVPSAPKHYVIRLRLAVKD